jgi:N-methylhydantoinase B/oxoprolinase/acetone carboxylase alpha subunit
MRPREDGTHRIQELTILPISGDSLLLKVEVTIAGDEMWLHFESPKQVRAGINMIYTALLSSVYCAVKAAIDPTIPPNAGLTRPLTVTAPEGTIFNAVHGHMTNAANLPVEALEAEYPLTVRCYELIDGSGTTAGFAAGWVCAASIAPRPTANSGSTARGCLRRPGDWKAAKRAGAAPSTSATR